MSWKSPPKKVPVRCRAVSPSECEDEAGGRKRLVRIGEICHKNLIFVRRRKTIVEFTLQLRNGAKDIFHNHVFILIFLAKIAKYTLKYGWRL